MQKGLPISGVFCLSSAQNVEKESLGKKFSTRKYVENVENHGEKRQLFSLFSVGFGGFSTFSTAWAVENPVFRSIVQVAQVGGFFANFWLFEAKNGRAFRGFFASFLLCFFTLFRRGRNGAFRP